MVQRSTLIFALVLCFAVAYGTNTGFLDRLVQPFRLIHANSEIAGLWTGVEGSFASAEITVTGMTLSGKWLDGSRPDFSGEFTGENQGWMQFPDDKKYTFEYDPKQQAIFWDGRNSGNVWKRAVKEVDHQFNGLYAHITGTSASAELYVQGAKVFGKWLDRARVEFAGQFTSLNVGYVVFPDDKNYTFEFEPSTGKIYWDGRNSGNVWKQAFEHPEVCGCEIEGFYDHSEIVVIGTEIKGRWVKVDRPDFLGKITEENKGSVTFPDDRTYTFSYDATNKQIHWDNQDIWVKSSQEWSELAGDYGYANITVEAFQVSGQWTDGSRPDFGGAFTGPASGYVNFPDDRTYSFDFNVADNKIYWDNSGRGSHNNEWSKKVVVGMAGSYGYAVITIDGENISGHWTANGRPDFSGHFTGVNVGQMTFPDDRTYTFEWSEQDQTIYWEGRNSGNLWRKQQ